MQIDRARASSLSKLMDEQRAGLATTEEVEVHGVKVTFVILDHDDQREGSWQSLHVLGGASYVTCGNIPREPDGPKAAY